MKLVYKGLFSLFILLCLGRLAFAQTDATAPTAPATFTATAVASNQINLAWSAATDNVGVTGYRVYYRTTSTGADILLATLGNVLSASNTGLAPDTKRWYLVSALDGAGNEGPKSVYASARTPLSSTDATAPSTPALTSVTAVSTSQLNLAWSAATDNVGVTGYRVYYRTTSAGSDVLLASPGNVLSYSHTGIAPYTKYWYSVSALDAAGNEGAKSALLSGRTLDNPADTANPNIGITNPTTAAVLNGATTSCAGASDNVGVVGVQFRLDGTSLGSEATTSPYCVTWNTSQTVAGSHTLTATARDAAGNTATSSVVFYAGTRTDVLAWQVPGSDGTPTCQTTCTLQSYRVYYSTGPAPKTDIGAMVSPVIPAGTQTFQVPNLNWGARYYYVVTAVYDIGESGPSNEVNALK